MTPEQIEESTATLLDKFTPDELNGLLDSRTEIDAEHHTLTLRELIAQSMVNISRSPHASKECRTRALQCAKQYLIDSAEKELSNETQNSRPSAK
jgi:hypothetical protein